MPRPFAIITVTSVIAIWNPVHAQTWAEQLGLTLDIRKNTNIWGSDMEAMSVRHDWFDNCYRLCARNRRCVAFTVQKRPIQSKDRMCYLKYSTKDVRSDDCCITGMVTRSRY